MTSSPELAAGPRRRRRGGGFARWRVALVALLCVGLLTLAVLLFPTLAPLNRDPEGARAAIQRAIAELRATNATSARTHALAAVRADPTSGPAQLMLARVLVRLDDGVGAEGAVRRAIDMGVPVAATHAVHASALVLMGDPERAIAEARQSQPAERNQGLRAAGKAHQLLGDLAAARDAFDAALRESPRDAGTWADVGRFRYSIGDLVGAIEAATRANQLDPGHTDALVLRGELVREQFGLVAALPWFDAALKRDPWHFTALVERAATLGDIGRTQDMLATLRKAALARPGAPQPYYLQAVLAARAGDFELARRVLGRAGGRANDIPGALLLGGVLDLEAGAFEQGVEHLRALVSMQPMNLTARRLLAVALLRTDASRNAIDLLRPMTERGDVDAYSLMLAGRGWERIGERQIAARFFDRAALPVRFTSSAFTADDSVPILAANVTRTEGAPRSEVELIRGLIEEGKTADAIARATRVARLNPGAPASQVVLGDTLAAAGRLPDAVAAYRRAADVRFDEPTMLRLIDALDRIGDRTEAARVLALFLSQNPSNAAAQRLTARWQIAAGQFGPAIATLEDLRLRLGDGDASLLAELALAYSGAGRHDDAQRFAEAGYALAPMNPAVVDAYGWALHAAGDNEGARQLLEKAVSIAPNAAALRWHLAQVYDDLGRRAEAFAQARAALADPRFADRAAVELFLRQSA